ncbi:AAA family ATPase [Pontibacter sp. G13]|uniref:ATP-dependent DNA helicase n=1 Tax=Pontibacter sp. G13 TaxID=3074898 RepID=UPI00288C62BE|nr:AAA family ATPase [Pontibacter sp. G13]WNJ17427.1 AAA family ATPase [Pontibacter sp. G13]
MPLSAHYPNTLTDDQAAALPRLEHFLATDDPQIFLLKGYAGTGKTFLMDGLVRFLEQQERTFQMLAPTGRAAMILGEKAQVEAHTVHHWIYELDEQATTDEQSVFKLKDNEDDADCLYIIDEASMVGNFQMGQPAVLFGSGKLLEDLLEFVGPRKILFVGDTAQLPPVGMTISPALERQMLESEYGLTVEESVLREVRRQTLESGILQTATQLRVAMEHPPVQWLRFTYQFPDLHRINSRQTTQTLAPTGKIQDLSGTILITQTNREALAINQDLRQKVFLNPLQVQPGDRLMITQNSLIQDRLVYNGQFVEVLQAAEQTQQMVQVVKARQEGIGVSKTIRLYFRHLKLRLEDGFEFESLIVDDLLDKEAANLSTTEGMALMVNFQDRMRKFNIGQDSDDYRRLQMTDPYLNALRVKYGYAITCHKAQGGEWNRVIVDARTHFRVPYDYYRWAYTAVTRAAKELFVIEP